MSILTTPNIPGRLQPCFLTSPDRSASSPVLGGKKKWPGLRFLRRHLSFPERSHNSPAERFPMTEYDGYRIDPFEPEPGRWRARISRLDGKNLKTAVPPTEQPFLDTADTVSYGHAVELAKQAIDGGGID
jgi:hypothetical protein